MPLVVGQMSLVLPIHNTKCIVFLKSQLLESCGYLRLTAFRVFCFLLIKVLAFQVSEKKLENMVLKAEKNKQINTHNLLLLLLFIIFRLIFLSQSQEFLVPDS